MKLTITLLALSLFLAACGGGGGGGDNLGAKYSKNCMEDLIEICEEETDGVVVDAALDACAEREKKRIIEMFKGCSSKENPYPFLNRPLECWAQSSRYSDAEDGTRKDTIRKITQNYSNISYYCDELGRESSPFGSCKCWKEQGCDGHMRIVPASCWQALPVWTGLPTIKKR